MSKRIQHDHQAPRSASSFERFPVSRRSVLAGLFGLSASSVLFGLPTRAFAVDATEETKQALANAQAEFDRVQTQMNDITAQYQQLSQEQDKTIGKIEGVQKEIDATQEAINQKEAELTQKRSSLSDRVASNYKKGGNDALAMLLSSSSFDDLISKSFYLGKVNEHDQAAIKEIDEIRRDLQDKKNELEAAKQELEVLKQVQADQLEQMKAKKAEIQALLDGLSSEVKQLITKRDNELLEAAKAEEERRLAAERARRTAASRPGGAGVTPGVSERVAGANAQARVVSACSVTPSPGYGYCAAWVDYVFENAGMPSVYGNADDMYNAWCVSSDKSALRVGMIIAVSTHPHTQAGSVYGHVGIYVGGNTVMDNIGYIRSIDLDQWISYYGSTVTPRWGWANGINLAG
ncbi:hypothetical protein K6V98_02555 [Collinsella sp. AGMB00827]|uniref:Peptidoglycan hydrolase PcsB coiled-coil domain-containing protein n=1 Tax=Collinsella ureilytica TaxID=2869515 RepID=A0ABS7MIP6_9ACTN|nr:CHAP domain-containing protein [Collinsella urealyticum]MBY4797247.1 hypothetical protein [Collinsella urealyticum]